MKFDLQRFADGDAALEQPVPQGQDPSPEGDAGAQPQQAGPDAQTGGGQEPGQTPATFSQDDVNRIVEARLMRERRQWEQRLNEIQARIQPQPQAPVNAQEQNRQFLAEFSRDPIGTLEKYADSFARRQSQQAQQQMERAQLAARDAMLEVQTKYPDFQQHSAAVMQHIQSDPFLSSVVRMLGNTPSPELYAGVLDRAYQAVKGQQQQAVSTAAGMQFAREQQALAGAKRQAAAPMQKAATQPPEKTPEQVLFEAMQAVG